MAMAMAIGASGCDAIDQGMRKAVQCEGVSKAVNAHKDSVPTIDSVASAERAAVGLSDLERAVSTLKLDDVELNRQVGDYTATLRKMSETLRAGLSGDTLDEAAAARYDVLVDEHDRQTLNITAYCKH